MEKRIKNFKDFVNENINTNINEQVYYKFDNGDGVIVEGVGSSLRKFFGVKPKQYHEKFEDYTDKEIEELYDIYIKDNDVHLKNYKDVSSKGDDKKLKKFVIFISKHPEVTHPKWSDELQDYVAASVGQAKLKSVQKKEFSKYTDEEIKNLYNKYVFPINSRVKTYNSIKDIEKRNKYVVFCAEHADIEYIDWDEKKQNWIDAGKYKTGYATELT